MITILWDLEQGSDEWHNLRKNYITGTDGHKLLIGHSIQEILNNKQVEHNSFSGNYYTRRGHLLETEAKQIYSETREEVKDAGFITNDKYPLAGYSPDGLVGDNGLVECKAFKEKKHLEVYKNLSTDIIGQTQFGLFVSEREWCDLILYNPDIEDISKVFLVKRIYPIEEIQNKFKKLFTSLEF